MSECYEKPTIHQNIYGFSVIISYQGSTFIPRNETETPLTKEQVRIKYLKRVNEIISSAAPHEVNTHSRNKS